MMIEQWRELVSASRTAGLWGERALDALERADGVTHRYIDAILEIEHRTGRACNGLDEVDAPSVTAAQREDATAYLAASRAFRRAIVQVEMVQGRLHGSIIGARPCVVQGRNPMDVVPVLVYDTATQPLMPGVRAVMQRARRLLYAVDDAELILEVSPERTPDRLRLMGQILDGGEPVAGAVVRLVGSEARAETTDDEGEFRMGELSARAYELTVELADANWAMVPLALG